MATLEASMLPSQWFGIAEEGRNEEEKRGIKEMKHTFASSSRPSASHKLPFCNLR
jgi:hypothetical protein